MPGIGPGVPAGPGDLPAPGVVGPGGVDVSDGLKGCLGRFPVLGPVRFGPFAGVDGVGDISMRRKLSPEVHNAPGLEQLRAQVGDVGLGGAGVPVLTVKPGFVRTAMTDGMDLPPALTASPERVAEDVFRAFRKRKNVLYTPWMWRWIMLVIRSIPEPVFKRTRI